MKYAAPTPVDYFATLVAEDDSLNLLEAAISLAQDEHPQLDVQAVLAEVDGLARRLRERITPGMAPPERLAPADALLPRRVGLCRQSEQLLRGGQQLRPSCA